MLLENYLKTFTSQEWLTSAHQWIVEQLELAGFQIIAELDQFHIREWSTVIRIPTNDGDFFFKACADSQKFEPAFHEILYQKAPEKCLELIAVDIDRGWMILPDGGQTLREFEARKIKEKSWKKLLSDFAKLQIQLAPSAEELLNTGLADYRINELGAYYPKVLEAKSMLMNADDESLTAKEFEILINKQAEFEKLLINLADLGIPNSIEHGDLHDANVFFNGSELKIFDWGDASYSHPFISLMIPLRVLGNYLELKPETHPDLEWARRAYFEPWTDFLPYTDLLEVWDAALHVGRFHRSLSWYKVALADNGNKHSQYNASFSGWVKEFIHHPQMPPS